MRPIPNIRFGTECYPEEVARRLRAVNIATWIATATHAGYAVVSFLDFAHWQLAVENAVATLLYAGVPLLHRLSRLAGPVAFVVLLYTDLLVSTYLLGTGIGLQFYYLVGVALAALYFGAQHLALASVCGAVAAALIIGLQLTVSYDTGLLPATRYFAGVLINAVVSCGILLLIVSYVLHEAARAEAASERLLVNILPAKVADRLGSISESPPND